MSNEEDDSRPSFGGGGRGNLYGAGLGLGARHQGGMGHAPEETNEDAHPPKKRPRLAHGNGIRGHTAASDGATASSGRMTFAQRQMAKMGWREGQGLGAEGKGRLNPIEVVQRPTGAGVGTVREKTKQAKQEEKRAAEFRGETVEDSSEEERTRKKASKQARRGGRAVETSLPRTQLRRPKYVSADDLEADLQSSDVPRLLLEFAIDLSGRQVSGHDSGKLSGFTANHTIDTGQDETEKRAKRIQRELMSCAESKHGLNDQRSTLADLEDHLVGNIDRQRGESSALEHLINAARDLRGITAASYEADTTFWEDMATKLESIQEVYNNKQGFVTLQEVAVAAVHPAFRSSMVEWEPLAKPKYLTHTLERLRPILIARAGSHSQGTGDLEVHRDSRQRRQTDFYETMIYSLWLPRVSSAVRNDFQAEHPAPMIKLVKSWKPLIPSGAYGNLMNQLIIPRIIDALKSWKPSRSNNRAVSSPDSWIFPWLEYLPSHQLDANSTNSMLSDVKRKLRKLISSHPLDSGIPTYLTPWRELLGSTYPNILASHLLPRLAAIMSQRFVINPADQEMEPIETVLTYAPLFPADTMARLLVAEFFPKFHNTLYQWLVAPTVNYDEVTEWWTWWKAQIPAAIRDHPVLQPEWTTALNQIGRALDLGSRAAKELDPPKLLHDVLSVSASNKTGGKSSGAGIGPSTGAAATPQAELASQREPTFRDIITDWCEEHDLLCLPTREAHAGTGESILRITANADQRGGVLAYARGDVLYVRNKKDRTLWTPLELGPELEMRASER